MISKFIELSIQKYRLRLVFSIRLTIRIMRFFIACVFSLSLHGCSQFKTQSTHDTSVQTTQPVSEDQAAQADISNDNITATTDTLTTPVKPTYSKKAKQTTSSAQPKSTEQAVSPSKTTVPGYQPSLFSADKSAFTEHQAPPATLIKEETLADLKALGVTEVLDFPFDPVDNELSEYVPPGTTDFSAYGFITPGHKLETLINQELESLRSPSKESGNQANLLDRLRRNLKMDLTQDNSRIRAELAWFLRNPDYLTRTFTRSARYMHHVVDEVEKRNLPMELALLPFVESAYNPFAYSHGRASGLWQFIPGTGKYYGLEQDWWYDGRRDVLASTDAALNYLSHLNRLFNGDWMHALASYNAGSGRVGSAIRRNEKVNKATDFWSLPLPNETRSYVPKLIALSKIVQSPETYNIELPFIPDEPYFAKVEIGGQLDLAQAAKLAEVDISEIYQLNPGFNQWASSPLGPHHLLVPLAQAEIFRKNLKTLPPEMRLNWHRYSVKSGDSLIKIARNYQTTPMLIKEINKLPGNTIRVNQKLLIPVASKDSTYYDLSETNRLQQRQANIQAKQSNEKITYTVKSGDTIWDLARKHKVGVRELARWNGMAPGDPIIPGKKLVIWSNRSPLLATELLTLPLIQKREMIQKVGYLVRKGDSLAKIANKFSVTVKDLVAWNNLDKKKYLKPGQKLTIYVDITNS